MSTGMSLFVTAGTLLSLLFFFLLLHFNRKVENPGETTGHDYDGIMEYDNPLPSWWYWGFVLTIVFGLGYLAYYPGLGNFEGLGQWSQVSQFEGDRQRAEEKYGPLFSQYRAMTLDELGATPAAVKMGRRLFINNCSVCHGATATGSFGFPNLTDEEWLWGREDEDIVATISAGRTGAMIAWGDILGSEGVVDVADYVQHLAGREVPEASAARGETTFITYCTACHGADGKGQKVFGAPDLTNEIWLYGNSAGRIQHVIRNGRAGQMPAFAGKLGEDKIHILAAYIKHLGSSSLPVP